MTAKTTALISVNAEDKSLAKAMGINISGVLGEYLHYLVHDKEIAYEIEILQEKINKLNHIQNGINANTVNIPIIYEAYRIRFENPSDYPSPFRNIDSLSRYLKSEHIYANAEEVWKELKVYHEAQKDDPRE